MCIYQTNPCVPEKWIGKGLKAFPECLPFLRGPDRSFYVCYIVPVIGEGFVSAWP